ncbi:MAG: hypothetical protein DME26_09420, partial [Verrucomicrobia bacterium]
TPLAGSPFDAGYFGATALSTDAAGRIFLAHTTAGQLRVWLTANGALSSQVSANPFTSGLTEAVHGLLHPSGFYMVADRGNNRVGVYRISGSGTATTLTGVTGSPFAAGGTLTDVLALNQAGTFLYAANGDSRNITTFSVNPTTGALIALGTQPANTLGAAGRVTGMAYGPVTIGTSGGGTAVGTAPPLENVTPSNSFVTETVDGISRTVLKFPLHSGLRLAPVGGLISSSYSIAILYRWDSINGGIKILDLGNKFDSGTPRDGGLLTFAGLLEYDSPQFRDGAAQLCPNTYVQVTPPHSSTRQMRFRSSKTRLVFFPKKDQAL